MMHVGPMGDMMGGLMVGSGWLALLVCVVVGGFARVALRAAGERWAEGRPWAVPGAAGFGLLAVAVLAAVSAWGTFFGFMGIAFAAVTGLGAWQSFTEGDRRRRREEEQVRHAARLGEAFRGPAPAAPPSSGAPAAPEPTWYPHDDARPGSEPDAGPERPGR